MAEDKNEFQRRLKALDEAGAAGDWDKAIELGKALRAEFPNSFTADERNTENLAGYYCIRGYNYTRQEQYDEAIEYYSKAIEVDPEKIDAYCNRNARIERHTQEYYYRKSVMLILSRPEGDNIQTLMEHLDKRGTPEVLNKLYHPKHASKPPDNTPILKRIESLLSKTPRKEGTDG